MFLLIQVTSIVPSSQLISLHSIMFLLIRKTIQLNYISIQTLHSIMFLLIPFSMVSLSVKQFFTFHNVSINTRIHLYPCRSAEGFTFHNVSINTLHSSISLTGEYSLHSIMFLLIQRAEVVKATNIFTLHSIMFLLIQNSRVLYSSPSMQLYIP